MTDTSARLKFAERLKFMRTLRGLTQRNLAGAVHIDRRAISHYETGKREPDLDRLIQLADVLQCSADFLLGRASAKDGVFQYQSKRDISYGIRVADTPESPDN